MYKNQILKIYYIPHEKKKIPLKLYHKRNLLTYLIYPTNNIISLGIKIWVSKYIYIKKKNKEYQHF